MRGFLDRLRQLRTVFVRTRLADPRLVWRMLAFGLLGAAVGAGLGALLGSVGLAVAFALLLGLTVAMAVFSRRAAAIQFAALQGQPGAAAAVLQTLRGAWEVTLGVAATRKKDLVHMVVGRPGVVLVGEGAPARVASLLRQQSKVAARAVGDVPIHEVSVGEGEGQVPLKRLSLHLNRLPRKLKAREIGPLHTKVAAVRSADLPLPKGPPPKIPRRMR